MVQLKYEKQAKKDLPQLGLNQTRRLNEILERLSENPYKSDWPANLHYEKLDKTWKGNPDYSLRLGGTDRMVYSIDDNEVIIICLISLKGHYQGKFRNRNAKADLIITFRGIKAMCETREQMIAFNNLLSTLKFRIDK